MATALSVAIIPDIIQLSGAKWDNPLQVPSDTYYTRAIMARCSIAALYDGHLDEAVYFWALSMAEQKNLYPEYVFTARRGDWQFEHADSSTGMDAWVNIFHMAQTTVLDTTSSAMLEVGDVHIQCNDYWPWVNRYTDIVGTEAFGEWLKEREEESK